MENENLYMATERFAQEEELIENEWQNKFGQNIIERIKIIDDLLADDCEKNRIKLMELLQDHEFFNQYERVDEISVMYLVLTIYVAEKGNKSTILDQGHTVQEFCSLMRELKFLLFRIDFKIGPECEKEFLMFLEMHQVSTVMLEMILTTLVVRPLNLCLELEKIFDKKQKYAYRLMVLNLIENKWPGSYKIYMKLEECYRKVGKKYTGQDILYDIPDAIKDKKSDVIELQELFWKLKFMRHPLRDEIITFLQQFQISDKVFFYIMKKNNINEPEAYLLLAEEMIHFGLQNRALELLEYTITLFRDIEIAKYQIAYFCQKYNYIDLIKKCLRD